MKGYSEFHGQVFRLSFDPSTGRFAEVPAGFALDEVPRAKPKPRMMAKAASRGAIRKSERIVARTGPMRQGRPR